MKGKQLAILLLLVVVLGGLWYLLAGGGSWSQSGGAGGKVLPNFPINDVTRVLIKGPDGSVNLVRKADLWTVQERADFPARFEAVGTLVRKIWDLKSTQVLKVGPSQLPRLDLASPDKGAKGGTLVQLSGDNGKTLAALLLGKQYLRKGAPGSMSIEGMDLDGGGIPAGRYVKPVDSPQVSLVSDTFNDATTKPETWVSKDFLSLDPAKSVTVAGPTDAQHWSVARDTATSEWKLADAKGDEKLDVSKVPTLGSLLSAATFNDVLAPDAKLEEPITTATITTFDGFTYQLKLGKEQGVNIPVSVAVDAVLAKERTPGKDEKPEDKKRLDDEFASKEKTLEEKLAKDKRLPNRIYLVSRSSVEVLLKNRADLLAPKPTPPAAPAPAATPNPAVVVPPVPPGASPAVIPPASPVIAPSTTPTVPATPAPTPTPAAPPTPPATPTPPAEAVSPVVPAPPAPSSPSPATPAPATAPVPPAPIETPVATPPPSPVPTETPAATVPSTPAPTPVETPTPSPTTSPAIIPPGPAAGEAPVATATPVPPAN